MAGVYDVQISREPIYASVVKKKKKNGKDSHHHHLSIHSHFIQLNLTLLPWNSAQKNTA